MQNSLVSSTLAHGIVVSATSVFSAADSDPMRPLYVFRYTIVIANDGEMPAQLVSRRWIIIDANGQRAEVDGPGVVGETPRLERGEKFRYQSFCPLKTKWGTMEGSYQMVRDDGTKFEAAIDRFYLRTT